MIYCLLKEAFYMGSLRVGASVSGYVDDEKVLGPGWRFCGSTSGLRTPTCEAMPSYTPSRRTLMALVPAPAHQDFS